MRSSKSKPSAHQINAFRILSTFLLLSSPVVIQSSETPKSKMGAKLSPPLQFLSPLQSLTLFSKTDVANHRTPRDEFLPKFSEGLAAEKRARARIAKEAGSFDDDDVDVGEGWEKKSEEEERRRVKGEEERVGGAYDRAAALVGRKVDGNAFPRSKYQFVGVIQQPSGSGGDKKVKWYAKKRAAGSKWNLRLVHVNREAIVKDLYGRGKVDIYGEYVNTGKANQVPSGIKGDTSTMPMPIVEGKYTVKERSWRTLWNFNAKHFFTDSSGAFWRERRLSPGLYTDGRVVYQNHYRYTDGKNGMKPVALLSQFLKAGNLDEKVQEKLVRRLKEDSPDVVIEE